MKLITINVLGVSSQGITVRVGNEEQHLSGDEAVEMLREKLAGAAQFVAVLLPHGREFEFENAAGN